MKGLSKILPLLAVAILATGAAYGQQANANVNGKVVGRDGKTPAEGITIWVDALFTEAGRLRVRERLETKTNAGGEYSLNGVYQGRVRISVVINGQPVLTRGEAIGDEIFLAAGLDYRANFDLSTAPPDPPATPTATAAPTGGLTDQQREELRARLEKEAATVTEISTSMKSGVAALEAKNFAEAIAFLKTAAGLVPEPAPKDMVPVGASIWANLAKAYSGNKQYAESEEAYQKAIALKPESSYYLNLSVAQINQGKLAESEKAIEKVVELDPAQGGVAYYNLGITLVQGGQNEQAVNAFKKSIEKDPGFGKSYYQLGLELIGQQKMEEAVAHLEKFVQLLPTSPDAEVAKALITELSKAQ
jgi:tetratricopeptide (TPR) repeat protein